MEKWHKIAFNIAAPFFLWAAVAFGLVAIIGTQWKTSEHNHSGLFHFCEYEEFVQTCTPVEVTPWLNAARSMYIIMLLLIGVAIGVDIAAKWKSSKPLSYVVAAILLLGGVLGIASAGVYTCCGRAPLEAFGISYKFSWVGSAFMVLSAAVEAAYAYLLPPNDYTPISG